MAKIDADFAFRHAISPGVRGRGPRAYLWPRRGGVLSSEERASSSIAVWRTLERNDWLRWTGEAFSVSSARGAIHRLSPDVVFLDISLPGESGLDLANELGPGIAVVFTTAFDRYAVEAFDLGAADYLLKPFGRDRFERTLARLRERLDRGTAPRPGSHHLDRLFARTGNETHCIPVESIDWFEAQDDYIALHVGGVTHLVHMRMNALEPRLDPARFRRVHRSHIVNLDRLIRVSREDGAATARLKGGAIVPISRSRIAGLGLTNPMTAVTGIVK